MIDYSEWIQQNQQREEMHEMKSQETKANFQESSPRGVTQTHLTPSATSCDNMCEMLLPGKLFRGLLPPNLGGTGHVASLCLECIRSPDSQKEYWWLA